MTIYLSEIEFTSNFYSVDLPDGSVLSINEVNESMLVSSVEVPIDTYNIEVTDIDGEVTSCPNIIGMNNDILGIETAYTEYEGRRLTSENIKYCTVSVYE